MFNLKIFWRWLKGKPVDTSMFSVGELPNLVFAVERAATGGFSLSSDFARRHVLYVSTAASLGLITTARFDGSYGRMWYPTILGLQFVENYWGET